MFNNAFALAVGLKMLKDKKVNDKTDRNKALMLPKIINSPDPRTGRKKIVPNNFKTKAAVKKWIQTNGKKGYTYFILEGYTVTG